MGAEWAALVIGIGLMLLAAELLGLANAHRSKPVPASTPKQPPAPGEPEDPDAIPMMAFTAAFVLGRYLTGGDRPTSAPIPKTK